MKRLNIVLAAALTFAAPAFAQMQYNVPPPAQERKIESPARQEVPKDTATGAAVKFAVDAPKPKCEDPGEYPGRVGMQTEDRRNKFVKGVETYRTCMMNFVDERKGVIKANEVAARQAIDDFNARMKKLNDEQEKSRE